ncbi:MAG: phosphotransferase family protein [Desertimonas sp.]
MGKAAAVTGIETITPDWLSAALGCRVRAVEAQPVGTGQVADTYRLVLEGDDTPPTVIAKVPSADEVSRTASKMTRTYEIEASFYRDLANGLAVRSPHCFYADHDPETDAYVVMLEDVAPAEQGDQIAGLDEPTIVAAIDELAHLHGARWGDPRLAELGWLVRNSPENIAGTAALMGGCAGPFLERYRPRLAPESVAATERIMPCIGEYLAQRTGPQTVVHGDFRADNLLVGGERVVVVDWQTVGLGPPAGDLAYLLGTSLLPEDRRRLERELIGRYLDGVRAHGGEVDGDWLWTEYRKASYAGLLMAVVASILVGQTERGDEMFLAMADRSAALAADVDAAALLPG